MIIEYQSAFVKKILNDRITKLEAEIESLRNVIKEEKEEVQKKLEIYNSKSLVYRLFHRKPKRKYSYMNSPESDIMWLKAELRELNERIEVLPILTTVHMEDYEAVRLGLKQ